MGIWGLGRAGICEVGNWGLNVGRLGNLGVKADWGLGSGRLVGKPGLNVGWGCVSGKDWGLNVPRGGAWG